MKNARITAAKAQADRLTTRLRDLGVEIKRTQSLEGIAAINNFSDWNRYQAHMEHDAPDDFGAMAGGRLHRIILMRPGEGKTGILLLRFADAILEGKGIPIFIDCVRTNSLEALPEEVRRHATRITASFDKDGKLEDIPAPSGPIRALWVDLVGESLPGAPAVAKAFCSLAAAIQSNWGRDFFGRVSVVLIDEFQRVDERNADVFAQALPTLASSGAQLIVATQLVSSVMPLSSLDFALITTSDWMAAAKTYTDDGRKDFRDRFTAEFIKRTKAICLADQEALLESDFSTDNTLTESIARLSLRWLIVGVGHRGDGAIPPRVLRLEQIIAQWRLTARQRGAASRTAEFEDSLNAEIDRAGSPLH